jgi:hypothetical protein
LAARTSPMQISAVRWSRCASSFTPHRGGPLIVYDQQGCPTHVGLVSWGATDCGAPKMYGVYTRISHHAAWLRQNVPGILAKPVDARRSTGASLSSAEFVGQITSLIGGRGGEASIGVRGGPVVRIGGKYVFEVHSGVAGRLIIVDVSADGVATQIFPNNYISGDASIIAIGQTVVIPGPGYGFENFSVEPPLGKGRLVALICRSISP